MNTITQNIQNHGPVSVRDFMAEASAAYYQRPKVFGREGDFITAPEISQVFGELIGLWVAIHWMSTGQPKHIHLVECGPGRGTLMADALRATQGIPDFHHSIAIHLIETSATLRKTQSETLHGSPVTWHETLETIPTGPMYVIGNEFLDALPIDQFQYQDQHWHHRHVFAQNGGLEFSLGPLTTPPHHLLKDLRSPADGDILECNLQSEVFISDLSKRIATQGGAGLFFDYGYNAPNYGETLQAVSQHAYVETLSSPGEVDLTAHVNFGRICDVATKAGAKAYGPVPQGTWLARMGLEQRIESLQASASPEQIKTLRKGVQRLVDPQSMGRLFKTIAICHPQSHPPEGF